MIIVCIYVNASAVVTVFKAPYIIFFSSYRRQIEVFSNVWFIDVREIKHSKEKKKATYSLKIPRKSPLYKHLNRSCKQPAIACHPHDIRYFDGQF